MVEKTIKRPDHLILVLHEKLDTLNGSGASLRNGLSDKGMRDLPEAEYEKCLQRKHHPSGNQLESDTTENGD